MLSDPVTFPHSANHTIFLSGPPGCGKTTLGVQRLQHLLAQGVPGEQILILVPQRTLGSPYYDALQAADAPAGGMVTVATVGGIARRTIELFWPLVAGPAGFARPDYPARFLTLETAQYYMDRIVEPFVAEGAFQGVVIPRPRLVSQIIDNLNKAAAVGFPPDQIAPRLKAAWSGDSAMLRIFDQVQAVALAFRQACLAGNLLDWSLQIEAFQHHLLPLPDLRRYLLSGYRHLIVDNIEEDIPASHDLLRTWLPLCESGLLIHDTDGGYRVFLGADPEGALKLSALCKEKVMLSRSYVTPPQMEALATQLSAPFLHNSGKVDVLGPAVPLISGEDRPLVPPSGEHRFHPQMLDWVADEISRLVMEDSVPAGEIAVLAPFLSDSLRFSLTERLKSYDIDVRTHRPSRALREEAAARCLLTLAKLAHPDWHRIPPSADVAQALMLAIDDLDPVRAHLLTDIVYRGCRSGSATCWGTGTTSSAPGSRSIKTAQLRRINRGSWTTF
jgi:superfamily I DNA/RNA helicase